MTKKIPKNFGVKFVTNVRIPKSQVSRGNDPELLKDFKAEFKKEDDERKGIKLNPLLYGKGQGGKGRGLMQEVPTGKPKKKEDEQPFTARTTTAKASWKAK
tara:strand:+ start:444 stop:746 length:303 start_codon:yes stop_codon:yes gene_type:complete